MDTEEPAVPWSFWVTTALGVAAVALSVILHALTVVVLMETTSPFVEAFVWVASSVGGVGGAAVIVVFCALRRRLSLRRDLALRLPTATAFAAWLAAYFGLYALLEVVGPLLQPNGESAASPYTPVEAMVAYVIFAVVAAPLFEEILFRGFLHSGWSRSRLGVPGTILLTSGLWAAMHLPASAAALTVMFVHGLLLGLARHYSGSLYVPLGMHVAHNLAVQLQTWLTG